MDRTSEHARWLASSVSCCLPWSQERPQHELEAPTFDAQLCTTQPRRITPLSVSSETSQIPSQRLSTIPRQLSHASHRTSIFTATKRRTTRRPTISGPFDFQQVATGAPRRSGSLRRTGSFRPLQLSIYVPGNELSPLPVFDDVWDEEDKTAGLQIPAPVLTKARSDTMLSRASTTFTIPRKPVPSRTVSLDATSRISMDSNYTCMFSDYKYAAETLVTQTPRRRPSLAASQSTQDFLDALDARLPRSPPAAALSPVKAVAEPPTVYRRASEQSLRLRTHLEERQQIERKGMECDTILEDIEKTPVVERATSFSHESIVSPRGSFQEQAHPIISQAPIWPQPPLASTFDESAFPMPSSPSIANNKRSRISAWLLRSMTSKSTLLTQSEVSTPRSHQQELDEHSPARDRDSSSSASTLISGATEPRPSQQLSGYQHRKGGSVSTTWTTTTTTAPTIAGGRGVSLDYEKIPVPVATVTEIRPEGPVGVAI